MEELPVIFRAERTKGGEVTAVFPTVPFDHDGRLLTVYAHIGQHGGGDFGWYNRTRAAKPEQYADLLEELRRIYERAHGPEDEAYRLGVYRRMTSQHRAAFRAEAERYREAVKGESLWVQGRIAEAAR